MFAEQYNKIMSYARRDRRHALIVGLAAVAALAAVGLIVTFWQAIVEGFIFIGLIVAVGYGFCQGWLSPASDDSNAPDEGICSTDDGWRNGPEGVGWYVAGTRIFNDDE